MSGGRGGEKKRGEREREKRGERERERVRGEERKKEREGEHIDYKILKEQIFYQLFLLKCDNPFRLLQGKNPQYTHTYMQHCTSVHH